MNSKENLSIHSIRTVQKLTVTETYIWTHRENIAKNL